MFLCVRLFVCLFLFIYFCGDIGETSVTCKQRSAVFCDSICFPASIRPRNLRSPWPDRGPKRAPSSAPGTAAPCPTAGGFEADRDADTQPSVGVSGSEPGGSKSTAISWLYKESQVIHRFLVYKWGKRIENSRGPSRRLHGSPQPPSALTACPPPPGAQCLRRPEVVLSPQVRNSAHLQCLPAPGPSQPASSYPCTQDRKSGSFKASGGWTQSLPHWSEPLDLGTESIWMRDR